MELHIPVYCGVSGCWQEVRINAKDCRGFRVSACSHEHVQVIKRQRRRMYAESRLGRMRLGLESHVRS